MDGNIALNKSSVLALREIWRLKLNSSKHIKVYTFLFKINYLLHQLTSVEFTDVINNGDSLTYKTRTDLQKSKTMWAAEKLALFLVPLYLILSIFQLKRRIKEKQFIFY